MRELDAAAIDGMAPGLARVRDGGGRLFILGVGGSPATPATPSTTSARSARFEAYAPTDNVSELTARVNDEGWDTCFSNWLKVLACGKRDAVLVFSVGGGNPEKNVWPNLVRALEFATEVGATVLGIVGRDGGYTARCADACVIVPTVTPERITPHTEGPFAVVWHLL